MTYNISLPFYICLILSLSFLILSHSSLSPLFSPISFSIMTVYKKKKTFAVLNCCFLKAPNLNSVSKIVNLHKQSFENSADIIDTQIFVKHLAGIISRIFLKQIYSTVHHVHLL